MKKDTIKNLLEDHPENVFQIDHKYIVKDPFGKIYQEVKNILVKKGYQIKILDLINFNIKSSHYNPLEYVKSESDAIILANRIARNIENEETIIQNLKVALLSACFCYLKTERPKKEQTISSAIKMLRAANIDEMYSYDSYAKSALDMIFYHLREKNSDHAAVKHWNTFEMLNWKYKSQAIISAIETLTVFDTAVVADITSKDDLELDKRRNIVYFILIPTMDDFYDIFVNLLSCQLGMCNTRYEEFFFNVSYNEQNNNDLLDVLLEKFNPRNQEKRDRKVEAPASRCITSK